MESDPAPPGPPPARLRPAPRRKPSSLADTAYAALKRSILDADLPPGHHASEQEVAAMLGMSRTPVHEAALRLQHEGLVEVLPRRGVRVLPLGAAEIRDLYQVIVALEGAAAALLAVRGAAGGPARAEMTEATEAMERALSAGDAAAWAMADDRFHRALLRGSNNPRLERLAAEVLDAAQRARNATLRLRPLSGLSAQEHRAILAALAAGGGEAARRLAAEHRERAGAEVARAAGGPGGL